MTSFDAASFKREVLQPLMRDAARMDALKSVVAELTADPDSEGYLEIDLRHLFAIPDGAADRSDLEQHGRKVLQALNKSQTLPASVQLKHLKSLLSASGRFEDPGFWAQLAAKQRRAMGDHLDDAVRILRDDTPLTVMPASLAVMKARALGLGSMGMDRLAPLLDKAGITVFEDLVPPTADALAPVRHTWKRALSHAEYQTVFHLLLLHSGSVVRDGRCIEELSVAGRRISPDDVATSLRRAQSGRDTNALQDAQKFLSEMAKVRDPAAIRAITFATVWEQTAELIGRGTPAVSAVGLLTKAGVAQGDARRLVATIISAGGPHGASMGTDSVRERLAAGQLEEARRILESLTDDPETRTERGHLGDQLRKLDEQKDEALEGYRSAAAAKDFDTAAQHLHRASSLDSGDTSLHDLALALPMNAPRVGLQLDGSDVIIAWNTPWDGSARFTVHRGTQPFSTQPVGGVIASELDGTGYRDTTAPAGEHVYYAVVVSRPGGAPSRPGLADLECLPAPARVGATSTSTSVELTWAVPTTCHAVGVELIDIGGRSLRTETRGSTFCRFEDLQEGSSYRAVLTAQYLTDDGPRRSAPASIGIVTRGTGRPIMDLSVDHGGDPHARAGVARWSVTPGFSSELWAFPRGTSLGVGRYITESAAASHGGRLLRAPVRSLSPSAREARMPELADISWVAPLLVTDDGRLIGQPILAGSSPSVRDVELQPFADHLRLTWSWPEAVDLVEVRWRSQGISRQRRVTPSRYRIDGGVYLHGPADIGDISISTVTRGADADADVVSGRVAVEYHPPRQRTLSYTARISRSLVGRASVRIVVTAETPGPPVPLGLHLSLGTVFPLDPSSAPLVREIQPGTSTAGPTRFDVDLGRVKGPFWIRLFPLDAHGVHLLDPPTSHLKG